MPKIELDGLPVINAAESEEIKPVTRKNLNATQ
jgi:hypothetical protein